MAPDKPWFKRRLYGWGWEPATWQGWVVIVGWVALVVFFGFSVDETSPPREVLFTFFMPITMLTLLLIRICYLKGEKPRWQWGHDLGDPE